MAERTRLRLDRALARLGLGTRKKVRSLIKQGRVEVDGEVITDHGFILSDPADVYKRQGHASIETTMDIYAEVNSDKKKESIENLAKNLDVF